MALIVPLLGLTALGCSTVSGSRTGFANRSRTIASSGGAALPTESGPSGATVAAELGTPEVATRATGRISGRVIDAKGRPVPNAEVRLADGSARVGRDLRATTDDAGGFTLAGLRAGNSYTLIAEGEVGRDALVGRASARAPTTDVRIRLRPETDLPTTAEVEDDADSTRRVERVSDRAPVDEQAEDAQPEDADRSPAPAPSRSRRVNDADLPPAEDAVALDTSRSSEKSDDAKTVADKAPRTGWRREKADAAVAQAESDPLDRPRANKQIPPPPNDPGDDGVNPLPPAKERAEAPLSAPSAEPPASSPPAATPLKPESPDVVPPGEGQPADVTPTPDPPPSSLPFDSVAISAEAPPKRRGTWADVVGNPAPVAVAVAGATGTPLPISTRRLPGRDSDLPRSDVPPAAPPGRFSLLGLKSRKPETQAATPPPAASCRYDAKTQRIIDFQLPGLDGKPTRFQDLDADYVLIDFWGTWCKPCIGSIPHLIDLQKRYGAKTLQVVGIATEHDATPAEQVQRVDKVARSLGVNYPLLLSGADGRPCPVQEALHISAYPTMILVDRSGKILWRGTGSEGITLARLDRVIAARADTSVLRR